ncbi:hypothetical protein [Dawidia soli]|uniref:Cytochrome c domain-containing protein n=1 Tax=Dawidia soli TaxID=2782352 RepID=A0AAP2GEE2_9BACT|nr:hypothetical protein [Dawidia soli]MBT1688282.1 hypothetical protein [Dawidia soli]
MRILKSLLALLVSLSFHPAFSQLLQDDFVRRIEDLRAAKKVTVKTYPDKTFVGALTGYYDGDALVLINTLTDAEFGGTETLFYIKNDSLRGVFISMASFRSSDAWAGYFAKHQAADGCTSCHGTEQCSTVAILFTGSSPLIVKKENGKTKKVNQDERERAVADVERTRKQLEALLSEL